MTTLCPQKVRYPDEPSAVKAMIAWQGAVARRGKGRAPCRAYRCEHCHGWHLTSQRKRTALTVDGVQVDAYWGHPRDAAPQMVDGRLRMHPFAANELQTTDPHQLLDLAADTIAARAGWMMKKALARLERRSSHCSPCSPSLDTTRR